MLLAIAVVRVNSEIVFGRLGLRCLSHIFIRSQLEEIYCISYSKLCKNL